MSSANTPAAAFGSRFGIGTRELERALGAALEGPIDHADLFFEASTMDAELMQRMFGDQVCRSGSSPCELTPAAR